MGNKKRILCPNCHNQFKGNYCNYCGQKHYVSRITLKDLCNSFLDIFLNIESGFFYTLKELTLRPGLVITSYLANARKKYYPPFKYLLVMVAINVFLFSLSSELEFNPINEQKGLYNLLGNLNPT